MISYNLIEIERRRYVGQLYANATHLTRANHEARVAMLLLALDLLEATPPYRPRYRKTVGEAWATAWFSTEALVLQRDVQALIDKINAS